MWMLLLLLLEKEVAILAHVVLAEAREQHVGHELVVGHCLCCW